MVSVPHHIPFSIEEFCVPNAAPEFLLRAFPKKIQVQHQGVTSVSELETRKYTVSECKWWILTSKSIFNTPPFFPLLHDLVTAQMFGYDTNLPKAFLKRWWVIPLTYKGHVFSGDLASTSKNFSENPLPRIWRNLAEARFMVHLLPIQVRGESGSSLDWELSNPSEKRMGLLAKTLIQSRSHQIMLTWTYNYQNVKQHIINVTNGLVTSRVSQNLITHTF